jgi:hypothetical protein
VELPKDRPKRQETILSFFSSDGKLANMHGVINIEKEHREGKKDTLSEIDEHSVDLADVKTKKRKNPP